MSPRVAHERGRFGRLVATIAVVTAVVGAGVGASHRDAPAPPSGGAAAGTANLWVDGDGGTCTRQSSAGDYSDAAACSSLDAAYDAASCGDVVLIRDGTYAAQSITGDRSCSGPYTVAAARGVTCTGCVLIEADTGADVTTGELELKGDWVEIGKGDGASFTADGAVVEKNGASTTNSVLFRDIEFTSAFWTNSEANSGQSVNDVSVVGGGLSWDGTTGEPVYLQTCGECSGDTIGTDVVFDGVYFHDIFQPNTADPHIEVFRIDRGYDGVTLRNSSLYDNINVTSAVVFIGNVENGGGSIQPTNIVLENNYFGTWGNCCGPNGAAFVTLGGGGATTCDVVSVRYNTFLDDSGSLECGDATYIGNLGARGDATCPGTFVKNVWQHNSDVACGTDTWVNGSAGSTSALGLGGANGFDVQAGSAALAAGESANCPATDHDGNTRPNPGATNCDAGADEG